MIPLRIVSQGDDYGTCPETNTGILAAYHDGLLRNTSVMAPGPAFREGTAALAATPGLCVGLHVVLNCEWETPRWGPVLPPEQVPSLVDAHGHFLHSPADLHNRGASLDEMMAEVRAQLAALRAAGLTVSYLDGHMGVGWILGANDGPNGAWYGGLQRRLDALCREEGLISANTCGLPGLPLPKGDEPGNVEAMVDRWIAGLEAAVAQGGGDFWLITHPSHDGAALRALQFPGQAAGTVAPVRAAEGAAWKHPRWVEACRRHGVRVRRHDEA